MDVPPLDLPGLRRLGGGKVRELYEVDARRLLLVATDRISAFDVVLPTPIPGKGRVLTQLSAFWFRFFEDVPNHCLATGQEEFPESLRAIADSCGGRAMLVRRAEPLPVEWVVRGYLAGSAWSEYRTHGTVGGVRAAARLEENSRLPEPVLTPTSKSAAGTGHDVPLDWESVVRECGGDLAHRARDTAISLYVRGCEHASRRNVILADTKFEFGLVDGRLTLIDECLTPDSSRFWPAGAWTPGKPVPSFDKQYVRDYLSSLDWDKTPPAPELPSDVVQATIDRYEQALQLLTQ